MYKLNLSEDEIKNSSSNPKAILIKSINDVDRFLHNALITKTRIFIHGEELDNNNLFIVKD